MEEQIWAPIKKQKNMAASNAEQHLRFTLQTICIQQLQEMRMHVRPAESSKWFIVVKTVEH